MSLRAAVAALAALVATVPALAEPLPPPTTLFTAIQVSDFEKAEAFYMTALGMKKVLRISKPDDPFVKDGLSFSGDPLAPEPLLILMHYDQPRDGISHAAGITLGMRVADARAAAARVRAAGYPVIREPAPDDHGPRLATLVKDPDGNLIELVQLDYSRMR